MFLTFILESLLNYIRGTSENPFGVSINRVLLYSSTCCNREAVIFTSTWNFNFVQFVCKNDPKKHSITMTDEE